MLVRQCIHCIQQGLLISQGNISPHHRIRRRNASHIPQCAPAVRHRTQLMIIQHSGQGIGHHMWQMATGSQSGVMIGHRHMGNPRSNRRPHFLYRHKCLLIRMWQRSKNDLSTLKQIRPRRLYTTVLAPCDRMTGDKPGIVNLCTIYDKTFDAGHVGHNRVPIMNRFANHFGQQVRSRYGGCANDHHIGVREDLIKIQRKLIDQPQRSTLLQGGRSRTPPHNLPAPTHSFERTRQRPRD